MKVRETPKSYDIVISGAGIVGASAACLFARQGMTVCLINNKALTNWDTHGHSPRVSAINQSSISVLEYIDVWQQIRLKHVSPYTKMKVWEHSTQAEIKFSARDLMVPQLGIIVENNTITAALADKLRKDPNITVLENTCLADRSEYQDRLTLTTRCGTTLHCTLLVGADGTDSVTRELCQIKSTVHDFHQQAIVTIIRSEDGHYNTAWQAFLPTGPIALLPLTDGRCAMVWSCDDAYFHSVMALDDEAFCDRVSTYFESRVGKILECEKRYSFVLKQQHAQTYLARKTVLIGDAAHVIHPLAGLGANTGITDAAALSQIIEQARKKGKEFSTHSVLRRYERWRRGDNAVILGFLQGLQTLFGNDQLITESIRGTGLKFTDNVTILKRFLAKYAMGINGDLPIICHNSGIHSPLSVTGAKSGL